LIFQLLFFKMKISSLVQRYVTHMHIYVLFSFFSGLKQLITPIFARLLEADPMKVISFEEFFQNVESIVRKRVVHVFCSHTWNCLKVYIDANNK